MEKSASQSVNLILTKLPRKPNSILDVGAGRGEIAVQLALLGFRITAIEPVAKERSAIRKLLQKYKGVKKNLKIIDGVAENLPSKNNSFDFCILSQVLEHVKDPSKTINEISRVLKPDGYLYLSSPNYLFPVEQHYHIPYFPLMNKTVFAKWSIFYLKTFNTKSKYVNKLNLIEIRTFAESLNYTTDLMIIKLCSKFKLKLLWSASEEARNLSMQIKNHWKRNPNSFSILASMPKKLMRVFLARIGILPMKLEYVFEKTK